MARNVGDGAHELARERVPARDQRLEQPPIRSAVRTQLLGGVTEGAACENRSPVVERVSNRGGRLDQFEVELQRPEKG